jgi:hypothetical protein
MMGLGLLGGLGCHWVFPYQEPYSSKSDGPIGRDLGHGDNRIDHQQSDGAITDGRLAYRTCDSFTYSEALPQVVVTNPVDLLAQIKAINESQVAKAILLQDGSYSLSTDTLKLATPGMIVRSLSGRRDRVILDGRGHGGLLVQIAASNVTLADLTLTGAEQGVAVDCSEGPVVGTVLQNLYLKDIWSISILLEQNPPFFADEGVLRCCLLELTDDGRSMAQNSPLLQLVAILGNGVRGWSITQNTIRGYWSLTEGELGFGLFFQGGSRDTVVGENYFSNCSVSMRLGMTKSGRARSYSDLGSSVFEHYGGLVRNNIIFSDAQVSVDSGIALWDAAEVRAYHNTIVLLGGFFSTVEWRYATTTAYVFNNLTNNAFSPREGAGSNVKQEGNIVLNTDGALTKFVNAAQGNLHLQSMASDLIDQGIALDDSFKGVELDIDGDPRDNLPDVGADEWVRQ